MFRPRSNSALIISLAVILSVHQCSGNIYTVSDDRIRSLDITPVLGRGYSIMTNQFHSTCLVVKSASVPSYNYEYFFSDMTTSTEAASTYQGRISGNLSYGNIRAAYNGRQESASESKTRMITSTMKVERFYSSLKEEVSPLSPDAFTLLDSQDYVGFFKACGPNYVRGIRRSQEVTGIFEFKSSSKEEAKQFASGIRVNSSGLGVNTNFARKAKFKSITSSMSIKIIGFGLGLTQTGSDSLVAGSLEEYNVAMRFAFSAMTRNEEAFNIGMVYGIEVVPWINNVAFQAAAKLSDENFEMPLPRSLIPRAYTIDRSDTTTTWSNTDSVRALFRCKDRTFAMDKYGYCCELDSLFDYANQDYDSDDPSNRICKPLRQLDRTLVKDNMSNNAEFIARLDSSIRYRLNQLSAIEQCISASKAIPLTHEFKILKPQDSVKYERAVETQFTLFELKRAVDPLSDYGIVKHLSKELDEWIEMFYAPCFAALYGSNFGSTPDVDVSYFMAFPWHTHEECLHLMCLSTNMRWDRKEGGCVAGLMTGSNAPGYVDGEDEHCAKDSRNIDEGERCKHDQALLRNFHTDVTNCWTGTTALGSSEISYFINNFCNPQLTGYGVDTARENELIAQAAAHCT